MLLAAFPTGAAAQHLDLEPGLYIHEGQDYIPIYSQRAHMRTVNTQIGKADRIRLNRPTSKSAGTKGEFVLVVDRHRNNSSYHGRNNKKIFHRDFTPENLRVMRLDQRRTKRLLFLGLQNQDFDLDIAYFKQVELHWQPMGDNAYALHAHIGEGEYAFQYAQGPTAPYESRFLFPFTIKR